MNVHRCPSTEAHSGGPGEVFEVECPVCRAAIEFFEKDGKRQCPSCKKWCMNPRLSEGRDETVLDEGDQ